VVGPPEPVEARTTRTVTRRSVIALGAAGVAAVCAGCAAGSDADPVGDDGFGGRIDAGSERSIRHRVRRDGLAYVPLARTYVVAYPTDRVDAALAVYPESIHPSLRAGLLGLYQRCTHLGCRVPYCATSGQFECPCHTSVFSAVGEYRAGPAPRGLDLFPLSVVHGRVVLDTSRVVEGLGRRQQPSGDTADGPTCI